MASVKNLKKDINYVLGDIIENVYLWENSNQGKQTKESEAIIDDSIEIFDKLIVRINTKKVEDPKAHYNKIEKDLEEEATKLIERINKLA